MKRANGWLVVGALCLIGSAIGLANATDGNQGTSGFAMKDRATVNQTPCGVTGCLWDTQDPPHVLVVGNQTLTLTGHSTNTITGLGVNTNTLYAGNGITLGTTSTATGTATATGSLEAYGWGTGQTTQTDTASKTETGSFTATFSTTRTQTEASSYNVTGTRTDTLTYSTARTNTLTGTVSASGVGTSTDAGTGNISGTGTATRTVIREGTDSSTATTTRSGRVVKTWTGSGTFTVTLTDATNAGTFTVNNTATKSDGDNIYNPSITASGTWTGTKTSTTTGTSAPVSANPIVGAVVNTNTATATVTSTASIVVRFPNSTKTFVSTATNTVTQADLATATPAANSIPISDVYGTLNGWVSGNILGVYTGTNGSDVTSSGGWTDVVSTSYTGAGTIMVWANERAYASASAGTCGIRITVDGTEVGVENGGTAPFNNSYVALAASAYAGGLGGGSHNVKMQVGTIGTNCTVGSGWGFLMIERISPP